MEFPSFCDQNQQGNGTFFSGFLGKWAKSLFFPGFCGALAKNRDERPFYAYQTLSFPAVGFFWETAHFEISGVENAQNRGKSTGSVTSRDFPDFPHIRRRISRSGRCPKNIRRREIKGFDTNKKVSHQDLWLRPHKIQVKIMISPISPKIH